MNAYQHTIKNSVSFSGVGLHSGRPVTLAVKPAPANSGIRFNRSDLTEAAFIPAFMDRVVDTRLAITIAEGNASVATTEHLLAALTGVGIDNAIVELNSDEVPIMDGSADPFVDLFRKVGLQQQKSPKKVIKITRSLVFQEGDRCIRVEPYNGFKITATIDFTHPLIRQQIYTYELTPQSFMKEIARARTFGFAHEVEMLRKNGLALGGSLDNAVVVDQTGVMNKEGLRFENEFVRHKILDLIGDLTLLGCPLLGHVIAYKSGHSQHLALMQEIATNQDAWEFVELKQNGKHSVMEKMVTSTMAASTKILPFLMPPTPAPLTGRPSPA
ncbi:MAG: UDP-3-O-[3-hydroxymyristoyl] N-acetylglucosamine deacetylase [Deltaproteobacteria bacterium RIFOXYD12_FULL_57_12]|nr:MAG: UDP-3-O-[3-hydroxymyristoyl] N-acetylglucosamine deacetylase [Deltaproteobacteria bacterium RIFOXYD12_FULL_57_12]